MLRGAQNHGSVRTAPHRWYSCSCCRFRKRPSPFPCRWRLALRAAPDHGSVRGFLDKWYGCSRSASRFRTRSSPFPCRWRLLLRAASNHAVRAVLCGWYSRSGCSGRKRPSRFPCRWRLLPHDAPNHGYLSLFRRMPHHTPRRPLRRCRLLCHRYSMRSHGGRSDCRF